MNLLWRQGVLWCFQEFYIDRQWMLLMRFEMINGWQIEWMMVSINPWFWMCCMYLWLSLRSSFLPTRKATTLSGGMLEMLCTETFRCFLSRPVSTSEIAWCHLVKPSHLSSDLQTYSCGPLIREVFIASSMKRSEKSYGMVMGPRPRKNIALWKWEIFWSKSAKAKALLHVAPRTCSDPLQVYNALC